MPRPTLRTEFCDRIGIEYPVILAGMGGVATAELVAAVSEAGGLGILGAASMPPERSPSGGNVTFRTSSSPLPACSTWLAW